MNGIKQSKEEIERFYAVNDPWNYQKTSDDIQRKDRILSKIKGQYKRALDIGCGEGWITKDLPAKEIYGYEISENASKRFPSNVIKIGNPEGKYDLIIATGVMYSHYDTDRFLEIIKNHASGLVLLSNIKDWEIDVSGLGKTIHEEEYPYRKYTQKLRIYDFTSQYRTEDKQQL